jgi:hypothetical protein
MTLDYEKIEESIFNANYRVANDGATASGIPAVLWFIAIPVVGILLDLCFS